MSDTTILECQNCNFEEEKYDLEWWDLVADTWMCPKCGEEWAVVFEEMGDGGVFLLAESSKAHTKYCSNACRQKAYRNRLSNKP